MPRDIPIIFSGNMVRSLINGRKSQTRRLLYSPRKVRNGIVPASTSEHRKYPPPPIGHLSPNEVWGLTGWERARAGDRLWVRENWRLGIDARPFYRADGEAGALTKWRPSIHMPRTINRLTLPVTADARVERLQSISEADAIAEGVRNISHRKWGVPLGGGWVHVMDSAQTAYRELWISLHGLTSWHRNPFVVVLTFDVVQKNIDAIARVDDAAPVAGRTDRDLQRL